MNAEHRTQTRTANCLIVLAVWAVFYLPWLGTSGLRSEEGHRVLPAVEMIESGNYLVPHVGGEPYLRKPPLINWLVAASFKLTGQRNEWSARLPSIVSLLAVALVFVGMARRLLGESGSLAAALAWLTSLGMIEKGRMIEIEAVYVSLFAIALICWLTWWRTERSPWLTWTVPWIFLGLGLLAKGPAHLFFFYALVIAILWRVGRFREALQPAHLFGVILMIAIFAAWAYPCARAMPAARISETWKTELLNRFTSSEGTFNDWLLNFPLALAYFLPFGLLLPFLRFDKMPALARGLFLGAAVPFCLVLLLPGAIQRYVLPTLVPGCILLALAVDARAFAWRLPRKLIFPLMGVIAFGALIVFPLRSATVQVRRPGFDAVAAPVNAAIPPGETLYAVNPGFQPYLFYIRAPIRYLKRLADLPPGAQYVVVRPQEESGLPPGASLLLRTKKFRDDETLLYQLIP